MSRSAAVPGDFPSVVFGDRQVRQKRLKVTNVDGAPGNYDCAPLRGEETYRKLPRRYINKRGATDSGSQGGDSVPTRASTTTPETTRKQRRSSETLRRSSA
jgi:hypothetical protein